MSQGKMKSPLRKLREFALNKGGSKEKQPVDRLEPTEELEELRDMQLVEDMREQYDGLLAVAESISGSAYDFSRSIQEMASYMLETFGKNGDGESGNIFSMLGKVQYEISKMLDLYAAHVSQTIRRPTESLLKELQSVEEMKGQYEEKWQLYNQLRAQRPKGKGKKDKGDAQLLTIKEEVDDLAMLLGLRLQSLKLGRELSLVTQAARHHTAQAHLFGKGLEFLNAVEPVVKQLSQDRNIDRTLSEGDVGIHMSLGDFEADGGTLYDGDEWESMSSSPMSFQPVAAEKSALHRASGTRQQEINSKSAPISPSLYFSTGKNVNIQEFPSERPFQKAVTTYALPSPAGTSGSEAATTTKKIEQSHSTEQLEVSRMEAAVHANPSVIHEARGPAGHGKSEIDKHRYTHQLSSAEEKSQMQEQNQNIFYKAQLTGGRLNDALGVCPLPTTRYSHSGPLAANKPCYGHKQSSGHNGGIPIISQQVDPMYKSGPIGRSSVSRAFVSPRISPSVSPPHMSPPYISELHKLPTPPSKSENPIANLVPSGTKGPELSAKLVPTSPLPPPPLAAVKRSRSIPSSVKFAKNLQHTKVSESPVSQAPPLTRNLWQESAQAFHVPEANPIPQDMQAQFEQSINGAV